MKKRANIGWLVLVILIVLVIIIIVLVYKGVVSSQQITGKAVQENVPEDYGLPMQVYMCPQDNCSAVLTDFILSGNDTVYCALYDITLPEVKDALNVESKRADVRVIIDGDYVKALEGVDFSFRYDDDSQITHNKFCVVDGRKILTGSFNPTYDGRDHDDNNIVVVESPKLAVNYGDEFSELWAGQFGSGNPVKYHLVKYNGVLLENYFCPEDHCAEHVIDTINQANKSVYFMTFSFTNKEIGDAVMAKFNQGLEVQGVFEKSQGTSEYSDYWIMKSSGLDVKYDHNPRNMHHKVFIIDKSVVVTGSFNPTKNGDENNDENVLIIHDPAVAEKFYSEYVGVYG